MAKKKPADINAEFRKAVKALVVESVEQFKDNKNVRKALRKGEYEAFVCTIAIMAELEPEFNNSDILRAADEGKTGLIGLAVDASHSERVLELAERWHQLAQAMEILPSLTWPKGFKV